MSANPTREAEFELSGSPIALPMVVVSAVLVVVGQVVVWVAFIAGQGDLDGALAASAVSLVLPAMFVWGIRQFGRGSAKLTADGLVVQMGNGSQRYKWSHIADARLEGDRGTDAHRTLRPNPDAGVVRIGLARSIKFGLIPGRVGTDIPGIPTLVFRSIRLKVKDPAVFVSAIRAHLIP